VNVLSTVSANIARGLWWRNRAREITGWRGEYWAFLEWCICRC